MDKLDDWFWTCLGETVGIPTHFPIQVNKMGQGPVTDSEADHMICWCRKNCPLQKALFKQFNFGKKANHV